MYGYFNTQPFLFFLDQANLFLWDDDIKFAITLDGNISDYKTLS